MACLPDMRRCARWPAVLVILVVLSFAVYFHVSGLVIVRIYAHQCGMGNQMFRYAAGLGLAETRRGGGSVCWSGWDWFHSVRHPGSFFLRYVEPVALLPECHPLIVVMGELLLQRFAPPFSVYVPPPVSGPVLVDGPMETFRYFPSAAPVFRLKSISSAVLWMRERNLTSAVHVRRGDYASMAAPIGFYRRARVPRGAVVVTDDPAWVKAHPSVFGHCVLSEGHDPGFDMALLSSATDTLVIGIGTFAWWGAFLSKARRVVYYGGQAGFLTDQYKERDRMPSGWESLF